MDISKDLLAAASIPLILSVLDEHESYGYEIIKRIKDASGGKLQFADGTIYPILRKLEDKELISSEWRIADNDKRRRYYQITQKGKDQFKEQKLSWGFMNNLLTKIWNQPQTALI